MKSKVFLELVAAGSIVSNAADEEKEEAAF